MSGASGFGRGQPSRRPLSKPDLAKPGMALAVKNTAIPHKLKCMTCEKIRDKAFYSEKQLLALRFRVYNGWVATSTSKNNVKCKQCTGYQPYELLCSTCGEVKTKAEGFAKAQRHQPDNARCIECVHIHGDTEHGIPVDYSDDDEEEVIPYFRTDDSNTGMGSNAVSSTGINTGSIVSSMADLAIETTSVVSSSTVETSSTVVDAETQEEDGFLWVPVPTKNKGKNKGKGKATESVEEKELVTENYGTIHRKGGWAAAKLFDAKDENQRMNLFDLDED